MNATGPAHTDCIVTPNAATSCVSHCPQDGGTLCLMFISQQEKLSLQGRAEAEGEDPVPAWWLPAQLHPLSDRTVVATCVQPMIKGRGLTGLTRVL